MSNQKNWIKRHPIWTGIIGFFGLIFFIGLIVDSGTRQIEEQARDIQQETDPEQVYINEILAIIAKVTQTNKNFVSTSEKAGNGEISFFQASELYKIHESQFKGYLNELNSMNVPTKYSTVHVRFTKGISLFTEAMGLAKIGAETVDADLLFQAAETIQEGTTEINTATEILNTLS